MVDCEAPVAFFSRGQIGLIDRQQRRGEANGSDRPTCVNPKIRKKGVKHYMQRELDDEHYIIWLVTLATSVSTNLLEIYNS